MVFLADEYEQTEQKLEAKVYRTLQLQVDWCWSTQFSFLLLGRSVDGSLNNVSSYSSDLDHAARLLHMSCRPPVVLQRNCSYPGNGHQRPCGSETNSVPGSAHPHQQGLQHRYNMHTGSQNFICSLESSVPTSVCTHVYVFRGGKGRVGPLLQELLAHLL